MYPRFAFALLFSFAAIGLGVAIPAPPVDERCGLNADFLECGSACAPTCANRIYFHPGPVCTLQCVTGCFCREGYLKNTQGECVKPDECDVQAHHRLPFQIPAAAAIPTCPDNEEFQACGSACAPTCAKPEPSPVCTKNCVVGCFCKEGHLRNGNGVCVPALQCEAPETSMLFAFPQVHDCKENEAFLACGSACAPTCDNPNPGPFCTLQCVTGCFCKPGYLKNSQGVCVPANQCGAPVCNENEEYRQCKGCDGSCDKPNPICPRICIPGCACKQGHLRDGVNGKCIPKEQCPAITHQCPGNEVFKTCGTACPATCANPVPSPVCTKNCVIGCFCQEGHLRNGNGVCVPALQCEAPKTSMLFAFPQVHECKENEAFLSCGSACAPTCAKPNPGPICTLQCVTGCFCKPGYLKNSQGVCVPANQCGAPVCNENEEYRQCKGCDGTCDNPNPMCPRICRPGCACKQGHLHAGVNGKCIPKEQCPAVTTQAPTSTTH